MKREQNVQSRSTCIPLERLFKGISKNVFVIIEFENVHFRSSSSSITSGWPLTTALRIKGLKLYALNKIPYYRNGIILEIVKKIKTSCSIMFEEFSKWVDEATSPNT